jgi:sugar phosphate isomerase/epimerase
MKFPLWLAAVFFLLGSRVSAALPAEGLFSQTNLVAWCIVPFDTKKRGPEERAQMLERLGIRRLAYDWRAEHITTFDDEVATMRKHGIEITAWWFPAALNEDAEAILACIGRTGIHPQLWVTMGTEPEPDATKLAQKIDSAVETLGPICAEARKLGCTVALYNHLGWFGEPANQVAILSKLKAVGHSNAGIVYNFHHGHAHVDSFAENLRVMKPYLLALNLNGMVRDGDRAGKKIIPLGTGDLESGLLEIVKSSGWKGPVGVIGHTEEDAEVKLRKELAGLETLTAKLVAAKAGEPAVSGREPGTQEEKDWVDNRWQQAEVGPFLASNVRLPDGAVVAKGLTVKIGANGEGAVLYDLETGLVRAAWTGGFLRFDATRFGLIGTPQSAGTVLFTTASKKPDDATALKFVGLHRGKDGVVLEFDADGAVVLDRPELRETSAGPVVVRNLSIGPRTKEIGLVAAGHLRGTNLATLGFSDDREVADAATSKMKRQRRTWHLGYNDAGEIRSGVALLGPEVTKASQHVADESGTEVDLFPAGKDPLSVSLLLWRGDKSRWPAFEAYAKNLGQPVAPETAPGKSGKPGPVITTKGTRGLDTDILAVDTLTMPYDNPYRALLFASGVDFTSADTGFVCTIHGDVWRVTGIDKSLGALKWNRYASGLFQPLGLKVRDGKVYVLGRDRITRLHDRNGDGEADFYESFHDGIATSTGGHDYVTCLETDDYGNFYYVDPKGVHRVAADGKSSTLIASGFRNPNGMGVSPDGKIVTVAPQQGDWTPSSEIIEARDGGWYGYGGPRAAVNPPLGRDLPLCWMPHWVDNSSGSQAWLPAGSWGPLGGHMLHLLWGRCTMMTVLRDSVGGVSQGAVVPMPVKFLSGPNRATWNRHDGALYVAGSTGWQTSAVKDGAVQRVRWTGRPAYLPVAWHAHANGITLTFSQPLQRDTAEDAGSYAVKRWNYRYASEYGSKEWSVANPEKEGRDEVAVKSARLLPDGRTVFLDLGELSPVMQMEVKWNLDAADGKSMRSQSWLTLNKLDGAFSPTAR